MGVLANLSPELLEGLLRDDAARAVGQGDDPERRGGRLEDDLARERAGHLHVVEGRPIAGVVDLLACFVRGDEALEGEFDILGRERAIAAGEGLVRTQGEVDLRIADLLDIRRGIELPFRRTRLEGDEALHDGVQDIDIERAGAIGGIEIAQVALDPHGDLVMGGEGGIGADQPQRGGCQERGAALENLAACRCVTHMGSPCIED